MTFLRELTYKNTKYRKYYYLIKPHILMRWKLGSHNYFQCQYFVLLYFYLKPYCIYQLSLKKMSQCCSYNYFIVMLCILCNNKQSVS